MPVLALKGLANQAAESTPYKDTIAAFRAGFADGLVLKAVRHQSAPLELNTIFDPLSELEASLRFPKPSLKNVSRAMGNSALALVNGVMNVGLNGVKKIQNSRGSK